MQIQTSFHELNYKTTIYTIFWDYAVCISQVCSMCSFVVIVTILKTTFRLQTTGEPKKSSIKAKKTAFFALSLNRDKKDRRRL